MKFSAASLLSIALFFGTAFDFVASAKSKEAMLPVSALEKGKPLQVYVESREHPVQFTDSLRAEWLQGKEPQLKAAPEEIYCFQIVACAAEPLEDVTLSFSDFVCRNPQKRIKFSSVSSYSTEGIDIYGKSFEKKVSIAAGCVKPLWVSVDFAGAAAGKYTGRCVLSAISNGKRVRTEIPVSIDVEGDPVSNHGFNEGWRMSRLDWLNSTIGEDTQVTRGYEPVTVSGDTLSILGRKVIIGRNGLPSAVETYFTGSNQSIVSTPSQVLAAPMEFIVETPDGLQTLRPSKFAFTQEGESQVTWTLKSKSSEFELVTVARLEFDGFMRYELKLKARKDCSISDIRLENSFTKAKAKYLMGLGIEGGNRTADVDWKWDVSKNQDMLWVGDVNGGIRFKWMDENYRRPLLNVYYHYCELREPSSWSNSGNGGVKLTERDDDVLLNAYSGPREMKAGDELCYNFELLLTPFRTVSKDVMFGDRYFHGGGTDERSKVSQAEAVGANIINIHHASDLYPFINYPYLDANLPALKEIISDAHDHGKRMKFYYTTRELTKNLPEFWALYSLDGEVIFPGPGNTAKSVINPDGPDEWLQKNLRGKYIAAWKNEIDRGLFKGELDLSVLTTPDSRLNNFYIGGLDFMVRNMGLDGVYIDDSALERNTLRRARKVIDASRPEGRIDLHSWNHLCKPAGYASCLNMYMDLLPYIDLCWIGEGRNYDHAADNWLIEVCGIPFGLPGQMLQGDGNRWRGMTFGITNRAGWGKYTPEAIWKFWDEYGIKDMEMIGWWDDASPLGADNPQVKATLYRGNGRSIIAIAAWGDEDQSVRLSIDFKHSKVYQPAIEDFQSERGSVDLSEPLTVPKGKGFLFVVE